MQKTIPVLLTQAGLRRLLRLPCILLAVMCCCCAFAGKGDTQSALDKKISVSFSNITLKEGVTKLEGCLPGVSFTYVETGMMNQVRVNFSAKGEKASEVLARMLSPFPFNYTLVQYHVVIWYDAAKAKQNGPANKLSQTPRIPFIKGMVTNLQMQPLPGVAILFQDKVKACSSDAQGAFMLRNVPVNAVLNFSAKGYDAQCVAAKAAGEGYLLVQLAKAQATTQQALVNKCCRQKHRQG